MMGSQEEPGRDYRSRQMRGSSLVESTAVGEIGVSKNDAGYPSLKIFFVGGEVWVALDSKCQLSLEVDQRSEDTFCYF